MAGAGFKTFNTGDVLTASDVNTYLMQQTVMVFASAAARTSALGANVAEGMISYLKDTNAVEVYDGSNWVSSDDPNAIQNTIVDAKGDIITATAADTPARLAIGSNGQSLYADSSTSTGLRWQDDTSVGRNKIINGDMGIWQRGTTFTSPADGTYTADRFKLGFDGNGTCTVSRQAFTAGTAPVSGYEGTYFLRHLITSAGTTTFTQVFQPIEDVRTFAGQTVTFSFWAKAETSRSVFIYAEQVFGSGGSATVQYLSMGNANLTTSWQRFSFTVALSSISGKTIGTGSTLNFYVRNGTTLNAQLDLWGVQVEAGSVATPFQTATGNPASELAACQRYYYNCDLSTTDGVFGTAFSTSAAGFVLTLPVTMRGTPSASSSGTFTANENGVGSRTFTALGGFGYRTRAVLFEMTGSSSLTIGKPLAANSGVIAITAEL